MAVWHLFLQATEKGMGRKTRRRKVLRVGDVAEKDLDSVAAAVSARLRRPLRWDTPKHKGKVPTRPLADSGSK